MMKNGSEASIFRVFFYDFTLFLKRLDFPFLCIFDPGLFFKDFQYFSTFLTDKNRKQFNNGRNSLFRNIFFQI